MIHIILFVAIYGIYYLYSKAQPKQFSSILITGASKGIGKTLAIEFARKNYPKKLFLLARNINALENIRECEKYNHTQIYLYQVDVTDRKEMKDIIDAIFHLEPPDLIIANAGVTLYTGKQENIDDTIYNLYNVNLFGVLNTILPAIPNMKNGGTIAIMSSQAANLPLPGANAFYSSSKVAVSYLQGLQKLLQNIKITIIQPGYIETAMTERIEDFPYLRYINADLTQSCQYIIKQLELGNENINFPMISHYLTSFTNILPYFIQKKLWLLYPNLIMGEKIVLRR